MLSKLDIHLLKKDRTWKARVFMAITAFKGISMTMTATPASTEGPRFCKNPAVRSIVDTEVKENMYSLNKPATENKVPKKSAEEQTITYSEKWSDP